MPLVVSSGHTGTDAAVNERSAGPRRRCADGAAALFLKTDGEGLMFYFEAISRAVKFRSWCRMRR